MANNIFHLFICAGIALFFLKTSEGKYFLKKVEEVIIKVHSKPGELAKYRNVSFKAFGENFEVDMTRYYPLYHDTRVKKENAKEDESLKGKSFVLYRGNLKGKKDSFALGFFLKEDKFRGYLYVNDHIYVIESAKVKDKTSSANLIYCFEEVIPPGCFIKDKEIDCSNSSYFKPLNISSIEKESVVPVKLEQLKIDKSKGKNISEMNDHVHLTNKTMSKGKNFSKTNRDVQKTNATIPSQSQRNMEELIEKLPNPIFATGKQLNKSNNLTKIFSTAAQFDVKVSFTDFNLSVQSVTPIESKVTKKSNVSSTETESTTESVTYEVLANERHSKIKSLSLPVSKEHGDLKANKSESVYFEDALNLFIENAEIVSLKESDELSGNVSCSLSVIVSPSFMKYFDDDITNVMRDVFLQTEMLNLIFQKLSLRNKQKTFILNFHIVSILIAEKDFNEKSNIDEILKKFGHQKPVCLVIGMDMTSPINSFEHFNEKSEACTNKKNAVIVNRGTLDNPAPMVLYFLSYLQAVTRAIGATHRNKVCHTGSIPNPLKMVKSYLLNMQIVPEFKSGIFSTCNVRDIETSWSKKIPGCLQKFNYSTCGNTVKEEGEQCDCGPKEICDKIDKCCTPHVTASSHSITSFMDFLDKKCKLRPKANCSAESPCCHECGFAPKGTKCVNDAEGCKNSTCSGVSSACLCPKSAPAKRSRCEGLECGVIPCARKALKPCYCDDECLVCCEKHGKCLRATQDLKVLGNISLVIPDGSKCGVNGKCQDGKCVTGKQTLKIPKTGRAKGETSSGQKRKLSYAFIFGMFLLTVIVTRT